MQCGSLTPFVVSTSHCLPASHFVFSKVTVHLPFTSIQSKPITPLPCDRICNRHENTPVHSCLWTIGGIFE